MSIAKHIRTDYVTVPAESGSEAAGDLIAEHFYLVVRESDGQFRGILTGADIAESPRKLVIDCLHKVPQLSPDDDISDTIALMRETKRLVLPAMRDGEFLGVVIYCDLVDFISRDNASLQTELSERNAELSGLNRELRQAVERHEKTYTELQIKEAAVERSMNAIAIADLQGRLTYVNRAFVNLWRLPGKEAAIGRPAMSFWHDPEAAQDVVQRVLADERYGGELEGKRADGETFTALLTAALIRDDGGEPMCLKASFLDVTEQRRTERALRESEERFRVALKHSPIAVFNQDTNLAYTWIANPQLGYDDQGVIGKTDADLLSPADAAKLERIKRHVMRTGQPAREEVELTNEGTCWYDLTVEPLYGDNGELQGVTCSAMDITARKESERALRESENRYRTLVESSMDAIGVHVDGRVVYANPALAELCGASSPAELIGRETLSLIAENDRERVRDGLTQALETDKAVAPFVVRLAQPGDGQKTAEVTGTRIEYNGGTAVLAFARDVSDRERLLERLEESEKRYRSLVESSIDGIAVSINHRIVYANPAMARLLEAESPETLVGVCGAQFAHPEDKDRANQAIARVLKERERIPETELRVVTARGNDRVFSVLVVPIEYDGQCASMTIARDITERKRLEQERREQEKALRQADKMIALGTLVAGVAHEINNPNSSILGDSQNLERIWKGVLPALDDYAERNPDFAIGAMPYADIRAQLPKMLVGIHDSGVRISHIVQKLRDFSMPSSAARRTATDLNEAVGAALGLAGKYVEWATDSLVVDLAPEPPIVHGERQGLEHMALNLVMNACQALSSPAGKVTVRTGIDADAGMAVLTVADEGEGIPEERLSRVFDPFFTTRRDKGGTGLGLSIVSTIVREHEGDIHADSEPGKGTTFTVRIPLAKEAS